MLEPIVSVTDAGALIPCMAVGSVCIAVSLINSVASGNGPVALAMADVDVDNADRVLIDTVDWPVAVADTVEVFFIAIVLGPFVSVIDVLG